MTDTSMVPRKRDGGPPPRPPLVDEDLADQLLGKARAEGAELLGPDGLLSQVTKAVLERALAEEITGHLGYDKHDPAGRGSGNSRNGTTGKTVLTDVGAVVSVDVIAVAVDGRGPQVRPGQCQPVLQPPRQRPRSRRGTVGQAGTHSEASRDRGPQDRQGRCTDRAVG